jgi:hypothetical protein
MIQLKHRNAIQSPSLAHLRLRQCSTDLFGDYNIETRHGEDQEYTPEHYPLYKITSVRPSV